FELGLFFAARLPGPRPAEEDTGDNDIAPSSHSIDEKDSDTSRS
ncbi:twin-arginine translocase subunit TatC, partial [Acidithiobacillus ferrooxidans]|nr:twin-arginine translocase subunit TatC [Acidithiobacillus ferrooxidans]